MYEYKENKLNSVAVQNNTKRRNNQFMIGSEYYLFSAYLKLINITLYFSVVYSFSLSIILQKPLSTLPHDSHLQADYRTTSSPNENNLRC